METVSIVILVLFFCPAGRGLGILSLARLTRSQDERVTMLLDPNLRQWVVVQFAT
jgi:hypothetical protein